MAPVLPAGAGAAGEGGVVGGAVAAGDVPVGVRPGGGVAGTPHHALRPAHHQETQQDPHQRHRQLHPDTRHGGITSPT